MSCCDTWELKDVNKKKMGIWKEVAIINQLVWAIYTCIFCICTFFLIIWRNFDDIMIIVDESWCQIFFFFRLCFFLNFIYDWMSWLGNRTCYSWTFMNDDYLFAFKIIITQESYPLRHFTIQHNYVYMFIINTKAYT